MVSKAEKPVSYVPAPFAIRIAAAAIDAAIVAILVIITLSNVDEQVLNLYSILIALVWFVVYHTTSLWFTSTTLGKSLFGLRVLRFRKDPGLFWSLGRSSIGYLIIDVFGLGVFAAPFNPGRQALHDYVFGSAVTIGETGRANILVRIKRFAENLVEGSEEKTRTKTYFLATDFMGIFESIGSGIQFLFNASTLIPASAATGKVISVVAATSTVSAVAIVGATMSEQANAFLMSPRCAPQCLEQPASGPAGSIGSSFHADDEDWTISGDARGLTHVDGAVSAFDNGESIWYWRAPGRFHGDRSEYLGRELRFRIMVDKPLVSASVDTKEDVVLHTVDDAITLTYNIKQDEPGDMQWADYCVPLSLSGEAKWRNTRTDSAASDEELAQVLGNLGDLQIRGEWVANFGSEQGWLDEVVFGAIPDGEPCPEIEKPQS